MPIDQAFLDGLVVRPFGPDVNIDSFECHEQIDWFLRSAAKTFQERRLSSVVCWMSGTNLAGYVTTSTSIVELLDGTQRESIGLKLPVLSTGLELRRIPALLIGMLGVCKSYEGRGLGPAMIKWSIGQALELSHDTGCRFVTVDADLTDRAVAMYTKLGFEGVKKKGDRRKLEMFYDLGPIKPNYI